MSKNLEGIVEKIRSVRAQKLPEIEKKKQRLDAMLAALQATRGKAKAVAAQYPELKIALDSISTNGNIGVDAENSLLSACTACEYALLRLRRDSINIGVAGKARQGKSQILQMLTGLTDRQIPTGDGGFCTAARSMVRNGNPQSATVFYLTEADLLTKKVWPSYDELGLSPRPGSIAAFVQSSLPSVADTASVEALVNWDKVKELHEDLKANPELVAKLNKGAEAVPLDTVRNYLVKDNDEKDYQVVDHVEIVTPFEMDLPQGMTVYDLPGLEDPTPGIRETMLKSVSEDADIVLLLRMPKNTGDDWDKADINTMDMLKDIYPADVVQPQDWIQLVLNLDKRPSSHNEKNVSRMKAKAPNGFTPVVCDCGSKEAVREMVDENINALVDQAGRIDDLRIHQAEDAFKAAIAEVRALYDALRNASGDVIAQESGFNLRSHLRQFMAELRDPFKKFKVENAENMKEDRSKEFFYGEVQAILSRHLESLARQFDAIYSGYDQKNEFPAEFPVFSRKRIWQAFAGDATGGSDGPTDETVRNQNAALWTLIRAELGKCCNEMVRRYFECVFEVGFVGNQSLNQISADADAEGARERLERFLSAIQASGSYPVLESAVEALLRFRLTFEETILPFIFVIPDFDDFDPDLSPKARRVNELNDVKKYLREELNASQSKERADALFDWLHQKSEEIILGLNSKADGCLLARITEHASSLMRANYNAFIDRFTYGDGCDEEWEHFADRNKSIFWKEEFEAAAANSKLAKDWGAALENLAAAL
ncbi:MAG: hypothetical protein IK066_07935 [Kiritimatiellae bacterium]|nr:hypothetical protein [Kiritimatiellia bacterium]